MASSSSQSRRDMEMTRERKPLIQPAKVGVAGANLVREAGKEILREAKDMTRRDHANMEKIPEMQSGDIPTAGLGQDAYGVGIMCMTQGHDALVNATSGVTKFEGAFVIAFGFGVLFTNGLLQLFLIIYTRKYVLHQLADSMRELYGKYHSEMFDDDQNFIHQHWEKWPQEYRRQLCQFPLSVDSFFFMILLIWTLMMFGEVRSCMRIGWDLSVLPELGYGKTLEACTADGKHIICGMRPKPRWSIYLFVLLPRFFIAYITWWYGCRWLTSTPSFADLILNSCALGFITSVDEVLYSAVVPEHVRRMLESTSIYSPRRASEHALRAWKEINLLNYLMSLLYWLIGGFATWLYIYRMQPVLPEWQWDVSERCTEREAPLMSSNAFTRWVVSLLPS